MPATTDTAMPAADTATISRGEKRVQWADEEMKNAKAAMVRRQNVKMTTQGFESASKMIQGFAAGYGLKMSIFSSQEQPAAEAEPEEPPEEVSGSEDEAGGEDEGEEEEAANVMPPADSTKSRKPSQPTKFIRLSPIKGKWKPEIVLIAGKPLAAAEANKGTLQNQKVFIGDSTIGPQVGKGLFVTHEIGKGEVISKFEGRVVGPGEDIEFMSHVITLEQANGGRQLDCYNICKHFTASSKLTTPVGCYPAGCNSYFPVTARCQDGRSLFEVGLAAFANSSLETDFEPNCRVERRRFHGGEATGYCPQPFLIATRALIPGEEVLFDYAYPVAIEAARDGAKTKRPLETAANAAALTGYPEKRVTKPKPAPVPKPADRAKQLAEQEKVEEEQKAKNLNLLVPLDLDSQGDGQSDSSGAESEPEEDLEEEGEEGDDPATGCCDLPPPQDCFRSDYPMQAVVAAAEAKPKTKPERKPSVRIKKAVKKGKAVVAATKARRAAAASAQAWAKTMRAVAAAEQAWAESDLRVV